MVLAAAVAGQSTYSAIWFGVAVLAPALREELGLTLAQTGVLISAPLGGSIVSLYLWGLLTDRFGERSIFSAGLAACGAALVVASTADAFAPLTALLLTAGALGASVQGSGGRAVMHWFDESQRGLALGLRQTAVPLGGLGAALLLPIAVAAGEPRAGFAGLGVAAIVGAAIAVALLRDGPRGGARAAGGAASVLRDRRIWILSGGSALLLAPQMCVVGFAVLFLHDRHGMSAGRAGAVLAVVQVLSAGARIAAGRWSDALRSRIVPLRRISVVCAGAVALTAALADAPLAILVPVLVAACVVAQSWNALSFTAAAELAGYARSGTAIGVQQTALSVAAAVFPGAFGAAVAATSWRTAFFAVAAFPLLGAAALRPLAAADVSAERAPTPTDSSRGEAPV